MCCKVSERTALRVHAWAARGAEDCGEVSGKLDKDLVCVHPGASHLLHTWNLVVWIGNLYYWNRRGMGCGKDSSMSAVVE